MEPIDPAAYFSLFENNPDGNKIFQELSSLFYDRLSYTRGDINHSIFLEGQRSVLEYIIKKMYRATQPIIITESEEDGI